MDSTAVTLSKKLSNGHRSFAAYGGAFDSHLKKMFGGSGAVEEDYGEIFGCSGASIPFLDVPELSESKVSVDVRSSKLDYSKIFGGFEDSSFCLRYDELSLEPNRRKRFEEECAPAERSSLSQASENSSSTEGCHDVLSPESSNQVVNGPKKFTMSYNKVSNGNANGSSGTTNGTTHIAQLNAVRGYAHLIDEATPIHRTEGVKPDILGSRENESSPTGNIYHDGLMEAINSERASEDALAGETRKQTPRSGVEVQNAANWFKSNSIDNTVNRYEVGHETHCSKVPSSCSLPRNFNLGNNNDKTGSNEGSTSAYSPPHFDDEVDTNSVAATSAAALRKAIEDAQAKIKVAKEIMERKKAGLRNGAKSFSRRLKPEESKEDKVANGVNMSKKKTTLEVCDVVDIPFRSSSGTRQQNISVQTPCKEIPRHTIYGEPCKEIPGQLWEEAEVSEAEQFYDAETTGENWPPTIEVDISLDSVATKQKNVAVLGQATEELEVKQIVSGAKVADKEALCHKLKPTVDENRHEKPEPVSVAEDGINKSVDKLNQKERKRWSKPNQTVEVGRMLSVDKTAQKERKRADEVSKNLQPRGEGPKPADGGDVQEEIERRIKLLNGSVGASDCECESEKGSSKLMLDVTVFNHEKNETEQLFTLKRVGYVEAGRAFYETEKSGRSSMEFLEPMKDGKSLEIMGMEDMKHIEREFITRECTEGQGKGEEYRKQEERKEQNDAHGVEENNEMFISNKFHFGKEIAKILSHDDEAEATEKIFDESALRKKEDQNTQEESSEQVACRRTNAETNIVEGDEHEVKAAMEEELKEAPAEEPDNQSDDVGAADKISNEDEIDNQSETQESLLQAESDETFEASEEVLVSKVGGGTLNELIEGFFESDDSMNVKEAMEEKQVLQMEDFPIGFELVKMMKPVEDKTEGVFVNESDTTDEGRIDSSFVQKPKDEPSSQVEMVDDSREHSEEMISEVEKVDGYVKESEVSVNLEDGEDNSECFEGQRWVDNGTNVKDIQSSGSSEGEVENIELEEETGTSLSEEKDHESHKEIPISQKTEVNESQQETLLRQGADTNDNSRIETPISQKAEVNESHQETLLRQSADTNEESDRVASQVKENTGDESLQKEAKLEKEHLRRVDAAKEREREIEKGRMAVERAVREARERALAEARERAASEKATAGARRRGVAEAPERVGKTSADVGAKHTAEKSSREAKLKAERAAVERATAEARARAFEKAMSSKAASDARKQNLEAKGNASSRYPSSSNHEVSNSTDKPDGANIESAQRCKARSERHQRISERAAKALAEKNRRDLLAQREQAERNRLAETLDIEVKRWSSGKEGNLRALLSTLQYILGPDSGWQPIPLTEIIKTAAVKKAYRKATLSVHPDKLQQRGANIQQKYICEKVFDLLKEAWNKFNVEER